MFCGLMRCCSTCLVIVKLVYDIALEKFRMFETYNFSPYLDFLYTGCVIYHYVTMVVK